MTGPQLPSEGEAWEAIVGAVEKYLKVQIACTLISHLSEEVEVESLSAAVNKIYAAL